MVDKKRLKMSAVNGTAVLVFLSACLFPHTCFASPVFENPNFSLDIGAYLRTDLVTFKNVTGLDSANRDDRTFYLGIDYSIDFNLKFKNSDADFFLRLERNGITDYDAPVFIHNTLTTSDGPVSRYRGTELLPQVEEFWLDFPLSRDFRLRSGLFIYEVGGGFSLSGGYENYGVTLYREWENAAWRFHYFRPDLVYKNHLGPRIPQEEEQDVRYHHNASNFFATDLKVRAGKSCINPYVGVLADYTSEGKRDNLFSAPTRQDILGTLGIAYKNEGERLYFSFEFAHNFGKAKSSGSEYGDVYHTGYMVFTEAKYCLGKLTPSTQFLLCSGNKVTPEMAQNADTTLTSGKNRAFSYLSPLNYHFGNSVSSSNAEARPVVLMGAGYGLNYGVPRPETFASSDFDNLIMPSLGLDFQATEKLSIGVYGYYILSFARGAGTLHNQGRMLSRELGQEIDTSIEYRVNKNILINLLAGYFLPGKFYKEERDDVSGSLLTPYLRGDGKADPAYQIELAVEFTF